MAKANHITVDSKLCTLSQSQQPKGPHQIDLSEGVLGPLHEVFMIIVTIEMLLESFF